MATNNQRHGIKFYMQECDKKGVALANAEVVDLESKFVGLNYAAAKGLDTLGKAKNIYTEKFTGEDRVNVYVPEEITREQTTVTFTFYILGEHRRGVYDDFLAYVTKGFHNYWDNKRRKRITFYVEDSIEPSSEQWYGGTPYLELNLKVKNVFGRTFNVE